MTSRTRRRLCCAAALMGGALAAGIAVRRTAGRAPVASSGSQAWQEIDWSAQLRDVYHGAGRIRVLDHGQGPALVLLHGMASSWQWWLECLPELGRHFRVIALDIPGFGESDPLPSGWTMADQADAIAAVCAELGVAEATVLGHSMGGLVALALEAGHPALVQRLVLVGAGGVPMSERHLETVLRGLRLAQRSVASPQVMRLLGRSPRALRTLLSAAMVNAVRLTDELALQVAPSLAAPGFADAIVASASAVRASRPEEVATPTLLLWGAADRFSPLRSALAMRSAVPHAHLEVIPDVGHMPMIEAPEAFTELLIRYADPTVPLPRHNEFIGAAHDQ